MSKRRDHIKLHIVVDVETLLIVHFTITGWKGSDIGQFKRLIAKLPKLNKVYHSAPTKELRDYMKQQVGRHLNSVKKACDDILTALSSDDTQQMQSAVAGLKDLLLATEVVKNKQRE